MISDAQRRVLAAVERGRGFIDGTGRLRSEDFPPAFHGVSAAACMKLRYVGRGAPINEGAHRAVLTELGSTMLSDLGPRADDRICAEAGCEDAASGGEVGGVPMCASHYADFLRWRDEKRASTPRAKDEPLFRTPKRGIGPPATPRAEQ